MSCFRFHKNLTRTNLTQHHADLFKSTTSCAVLSNSCLRAWGRRPEETRTTPSATHIRCRRDIVLRSSQEYHLSDEVRTCPAMGKRLAHNTTQWHLHRSGKCLKRRVDSARGLACKSTLNSTKACQQRAIPKHLSNSARSTVGNASSAWKSNMNQHLPQSREAAPHLDSRQKRAYLSPSVVPLANIQHAARSHTHKHLEPSMLLRR